MIRHTPLRRTRLKKRPRRGDNSRLRHEWAAEHESCAACWARAGQFGVWLETHHLIKCGRIDDPRNLLRLCAGFGATRCHDLAEGHQIPMDAGPHWYWPTLSLGMCLTLKSETDSENYDPDWLASVYKRRLPELEPVPNVFLNLRERA